MHDYKAGAGVAVRAAEWSGRREKLPSSCRSRHSTIKQHSRLWKGACSSGRQLLLEEQSVVRKTWGTLWWLLASGRLGGAQQMCTVHLPSLGMSRSRQDWHGNQPHEMWFLITWRCCSSLLRAMGGWRPFGGWVPDPKQPAARCGCAWSCCALLISPAFVNVWPTTEYLKHWDFKNVDYFSDCSRNGNNPRFRLVLEEEWFSLCRAF